MATRQTTITRTTIRSGAVAHRRRRRVRAKAASRARSTSRSTSKTSATVVRDRDRGALRYILPAVVVAGLAIWLWPKIAGAGQQKPTNGGTNGGRPGGQRTHPPAGTVAVVQAVGDLRGMNLRSEASAAGGDATRIGGVNNGSTVTVLESNIIEKGKTAASPERWWRVQSPAGTGYIRAVGPAGEWNVTWNTAGTGALPQRVAAYYPSYPVPAWRNW